MFSVDIQKFRKEYHDELRKIEGNVRKTVIATLNATWDAAMEHTPHYSGYLKMNWSFVHGQETVDMRRFERDPWAPAEYYMKHGEQPKRPYFDVVRWNERAIIYNYTPYVHEANIHSSQAGFLEYIEFVGESTAYKRARVA